MQLNYNAIKFPIKRFIMIQGYLIIGNLPVFSMKSIIVSDSIIQVSGISLLTGFLR